MLEHYPVFPSQEISGSHQYFFDTTHGHRYFVRFTPAHYLFQIDCAPCKNTFEVSFHHEEKIQIPDQRVKYTIIHLILKFISEHQGPIVYVCDNLDKKERGRRRLFNRWFQESPSNEFRHNSTAIEFEDYTQIVGIITFEWDLNADDYFNSLEIF
ncbi:DUF6169 family protein [Dyadobacter fermentans]|uniref:DUF6169 family protein n=1 Tax=Dyadobacter fermentans TaxID=94254 RepID=UPI001CBC1CAB|nr:DUF6169 family protein [Dyadobacter fermentans]MBZ1361105.1 hypothetical protein [Dyadobacter fermentans]